VSLLHFPMLRGGAPVAGDVTAPTVTARTINAAGTSLTLTMSESVTVNNGTGFTVSLSGGAATVSYASGSGSSSLVYTLSRTVNSGETGTLDYTTVSNGIEDAAGNDLASFSSAAITNNSTQGASGTVLFTDALTSGSLAGTQNGVSWIDTVNVEVEVGGMQFVFPVGGTGSNYNAEARLEFATPIVDLWVKYDLYIPANYQHDAGNHKGFLLAWSNLHNYGSGGNYGYSQADEILISQEMQTQGAGESQSFARIFGCGLDYNMGNNNWPGGLDWPDAIVAADLGTTVEIIVQCKAATTQGTTGNLNEDAVDPQDGKLRIWKDGVLIMNFDTMNAYQTDHEGFSYCYIFGAANSGFGDMPMTLVVTNLSIAEGNPGWVAE
jgi:hypothetical protein